MSKIATESDVFQITGVQYSGYGNKCVTKSRVEEMNAKVSGNYDDNQLVQLDDISANGARYRCFNVWNIKKYFPNLNPTNLMAAIWDGTSYANIVVNCTDQGLYTKIAIFRYGIESQYSDYYDNDMVTFILNTNQEYELEIGYCNADGEGKYKNRVTAMSTISALLMAGGNWVGVWFCNTYSAINPGVLELGDGAFDKNYNQFPAISYGGKTYSNPFDEPIYAP